METHARFLWPLYRWEFVDSGTGVRLRPPLSIVDTMRAELRLVGDAPQRPKTWAPLEEAPGLYREASALNLDDAKAVLDWINRRGALWLPRVDRRKTQPIEPHTRFHTALSELEVLRDAVDIHRALRGHGNMPKVVDQRVGVLQVSDEGMAWVGRAAENKLDRRRLLAWAALNDALASHVDDALTVSVSILTAKSRHHIGRPRGKPGTVFRIPEGRFTLLPTSLVACLWWQFARSVFSGKEPRLCPGCGEWFIPTRQDRTTCSSKCYMRLYRDRD